jgi:energy-coupling factor transport system ATP-binding protein
MPEPLAESTGLMFVEGTNFSGRTDLLREFVGLAAERNTPKSDQGGRRAYIGPEIYNALSGLAATVEDEIRLHFVQNGSLLDPDRLLELLGLASLRDRNPFDLSGGEQALTALGAALALAPERLSLDCCFEQVDNEMRERVLTLLGAQTGHGIHVAVADNRLNEYSTRPVSLIKTLAECSTVGRESARLTEVRTPGQIPEIPTAKEIVLEGIRFSYRHHANPVLRDVSIKLQPGEVYLLEGKNGSGKTTLAKILCGALRPQHGTLVADGTLLRPWKNPARLFAYHFQNPDLQLFCACVRDELAAGPTALGMSSRAANDGVRFWAETFGLQGALDWHPLDLPFVGRKRVALAATLAMARPWVVLDEPSLGQDDATSDAIAHIISQLKARGCGVLVISHSTNLRTRLAGRRLMLEGGILIERE